MIRLFLLQPEVVWTGRSDAPVLTYPLNEISYYDGNAVGTPKAGMTLLVGSAAGADDRGRQRIKAAPSGATGTLQIGRSSQGPHDGEVDLHDDDYLTIVALYQVWSKIPHINSDGTVFKDGTISYSDQTGDDSPPVANGGAAFAATASGGIITVDFTAANSFATADGATISTYLWDVKDGTITVGTSASQAITATFPAGFRYVGLTVTDSNGNSHTCHIPVYARNPSADTTIQGFTIESHTTTIQGQRVNIRILDDIPAADYPDGSLVLLWEDEPASASDRSHMLFTGWHHADPTQIQGTRTGTLKDTTLECIDVAGRLDILPGFALSVENKTSPTSWREMKNANMGKYLHFLLQWHSNALDLADFQWAGTDYPFVILGSESASLWDQVAKRANSLVPDYHLTCNTLGQLRVIVDPMLQDIIDRTSTVQASLTESDYTDLRFTHQRAPRVNWLRGEAIIADSDVINTAFSVGPGLSPGQGETEQVSGEQLTKSQSDLQASEGHRYARLNAPQSLFTITLAGSSDLGIEPADLTWVALSTTGAQRGLNLIAERGLVHQVNTQYQQERTGLVKTVSLLWERETDGIPAFPDIPPDMPVPPDYEPDPESFPIPETPTQGTGFGTCYAMTINTLGRTRALSVSSPSWSDIKGSITGDMKDFILDPWFPGTTGYVLASSGVWRSQNLEQESPTWTNVLTSAAITTATGGFNQYWHITSSITFDGYLAIFFRNNSTTIYAAVSGNRGNTWNYYSIGTVSSTVDGWQGGADIVPRNISGARRLYCAFRSTGLGQAVFRSDNDGVTWSHVGSIGTGGGECWSIHVPYNDNPTGSIVYASMEGNASDRGIWRSTDAGVNWTRLQSDIGATEHLIHRINTESYTQNRLNMFTWLCQSGSSADTLYTSTDGLSTKSAASMTGFSGDVKACGGFPYANGQFYALTDAGIFVTTDGGANWTNKTGNWSFGFSFGTGENRRGVIIPLWTE